MVLVVVIIHVSSVERERDGVPSSVSSSVVTGGDGRHHRDGDDGWIESNRIESNRTESNQLW